MGPRDPEIGRDSYRILWVLISQDPIDEASMAKQTMIARHHEEYHPGVATDSDLTPQSIEAALRGCADFTTRLPEFK